MDYSRNGAALMLRDLSDEIHRYEQNLVLSIDEEESEKAKTYVEVLIALKRLEHNMYVTCGQFGLETIL